MSKRPQITKTLVVLTGLSVIALTSLVSTIRSKETEFSNDLVLTKEVSDSIVISKIDERPGRYLVETINSESGALVNMTRHAGLWPVDSLSRKGAELNMMTFLYPDSLRLYLFMVVVPRDSDESVETEFELRINGSKGGLRFESMVTEHVKQTNELMIWFHCPREYLVEVANSKKAMVKFRGDGHEELYILSPTGQALHRVFLDRFQAADGLPTK